MSTTLEQTRESCARNGQFTTTHWSVVVAARALRRDPANGLAAARVLSALTQYSLASTNSAWKPFEHRPPLVSYRLSADGQQCVIASFEEAGRTWKTLALPLPVPAWLAGLTEAIAEKSINDLDLAEPVPLAQFQELRRRVSGSAAQDVWTRWAKWFFADPASRPFPPFTDTSAP